MTAREKIIKQRRTGAADMQIAGRAGGKTGTDLIHSSTLTGREKTVNAVWARDNRIGFVVVWKILRSSERGEQSCGEQ
jgi:hypothetical protein